jgi:hypothetical protein
VSTPPRPTIVPAILLPELVAESLSTAYFIETHAARGRFDATVLTAARNPTTSKRDVPTELRVKDLIK